MWSTIQPKSHGTNCGDYSDLMAMCAQTDPDAFFPEKGGSTRDAKRVCAKCEVREQCLKWAIDHDERFGIWGGMSERERRRYKREHRERA